MTDKEKIENALKNKTLEELESLPEAAIRNRPSNKVVNLTPPIINQVLDLLRAGTSLRDIQRTPFENGPQGQKWKLSKAQILEIENARRAKYAELLSELNEPIEP